MREISRLSSSSSRLLLGHEHLSGKGNKNLLWEEIEDSLLGISTLLERLHLRREYPLLQERRAKRERDEFLTKESDEERWGSPGPEIKQDQVKKSSSLMGPVWTGRPTR